MWITMISCVEKHNEYWIIWIWVKLTYRKIKKKVFKPWIILHIRLEFNTSFKKNIYLKQVKLVLRREILSEIFCKRGTQRLSDHMSITSLFFPFLFLSMSLLLIIYAVNVRRTIGEGPGVLQPKADGSLPLIIDQKAPVRSSPRKPIRVPPISSSPIISYTYWWPTFHLAPKFFRWHPNNAWYENANLLGLMEFCGKLYGSSS